MAATRWKRVVERLAALGCPEHLQHEEAALRAGSSRLELLEFLVHRYDAALLDDRAATTSHARLSHLTHACSLLLLCSSTDTACVEGSGSRDASLNLLNNLVDLVEMKHDSTLPLEASHTLLTHISLENTHRTFTDECQLFPSHMIGRRSVKGSLKERLGAMEAVAAELKQQARGFESLCVSDRRHVDHSGAIARLVTCLDEFSTGYKNELQTWVHACPDPPPTHVGQRSACVLRSYDRVGQFLGDLHTLRQRIAHITQETPELDHQLGQDEFAVDTMRETLSIVRAATQMVRG